MGFQNKINFYTAPAVEGDFANTNPRNNVTSTQSGFISGINGLIISRFCWLDPSSLVLLNNYGTGKPLGYLYRNFKGTIDELLSESTMLIKQGTGVAIFNKGDFFIINTYKDADIGEKVFANLTDGSINTGLTGSIIPGFIETDFSIIVSANQNEIAVMTDLNYNETIISSSYRVTDDGDSRVTDDGDYRITD